MHVRVWGELGDRLVEMRPLPGPAGTGLRIDGLPPGRAQTSADRIRAALITSGLVAEVPATVVRLEPELRGGLTGDLDLAIALAALSSAGLIGAGLRWVLATGRLHPNGEVLGPRERITLPGVVEVLCQTPLIGFEQMFEKESP